MYTWFSHIIAAHLYVIFLNTIFLPVYVLFDPNIHPLFCRFTTITHFLLSLIQPSCIMILDGILVDHRVLRLSCASGVVRWVYVKPFLTLLYRVVIVTSFLSLSNVSLGASSSRLLWQFLQACSYWYWSSCGEQLGLMCDSNAVTGIILCLHNQLVCTKCDAWGHE